MLWAVRLPNATPFGIPLRNPSDAEVILAVVDRHDAALSEVHRRYGTSIRRTAHRIVGGGQSDEVVQDVLLHNQQRSARRSNSPTSKAKLIGRPL